LLSRVRHRFRRICTQHKLASFSFFLSFFFVIAEDGFVEASSPIYTRAQDNVTLLYYASALEHGCNSSATCPLAFGVSFIERQLRITYNDTRLGNRSIADIDPSLTLPTMEFVANKTAQRVNMHVSVSYRSIDRKALFTVDFVDHQQSISFDAVVPASFVALNSHQLAIGASCQQGTMLLKIDNLSLTTFW
jgi:hypothetical protein